MAEITASMVKELRERTDAPMMECKRALTESAGDIGKAEEILRVKLGSKASKAASRITAEGCRRRYICRTTAKFGAIVEINCETDFVAKNDDFLKLASDCAALVAAHDPVDVTQRWRLCRWAGGTVESTSYRALVGKIGENLAIRRFVRMARPLASLLPMSTVAPRLAFVVDCIWR
jgi:elongation factor Ts